MKSKDNAIVWSIHRFDQLNTTQLYHLMQLRIDVFVVEQNCIYPELDGLDMLPDTLHVLGYSLDNLVAYARVMAPVVTEVQSPAKIGRVAIHSDYRRFGLAREMMIRLLTEARAQWSGADLFLSAQTQVAGFYESLGFRRISDEYFEDGIPHIDMESKDDSGSGHIGC